MKHVQYSRATSEVVAKLANTASMIMMLRVDSDLAGGNRRVDYGPDMNAWDMGCRGEK